MRYPEEDLGMKNKSSTQKEEEESVKIGEGTFIVDSYEKMLTLLDRDYEVEEELSGERFLMRKK